jgi:hypothetical protein
LDNNLKPAIDEQRAFELLRDHSRHTGRKLIDVAPRPSNCTCCFPAPRAPCGQSATASSAFHPIGDSVLVSPEAADGGLTDDLCLLAARGD